MIDFRRGDLVAAAPDFEAIVNTVNTHGVMGKGIALAIKRRFPGNFALYEAACAAGTVQVGSMLTWDSGALLNPRFVINFPTKKHWRGRSRIEWIALGLPSLVSEIQRLGIRSVAVPPLGCGNGGLDWDDVRPVMVDILGTLGEVHVAIFEPESDHETLSRHALEH